VDISFRVYNVWEHCVKQEDTKLATVLGNKAGPIRRRGSPGRSKYFLGGKKITVPTVRKKYLKNECTKNDTKI
jgi:hypothetical protein